MYAYSVSTYANRISYENELGSSRSRLLGGLLKDHGSF